MQWLWSVSLILIGIYFLFFSNREAFQRQEIEQSLADSYLEELYGEKDSSAELEKNEEEWEDLEYISDDLAWIDIAYEVNEDNQLTLKLDIEKYYGKLSNGIYRIVKPVYDNGYINIYSNEFEIK